MDKQHAKKSSLRYYVRLDMTHSLTLSLDLCALNDSQSIKPRLEKPLEFMKHLLRRNSIFLLYIIRTHNAQKHRLKRRGADRVILYAERLLILL